MDQTMNDFHILLPSNASMNYFPNNTPDHYKTKLAHPIALKGEWECCLSEVTLPGKYFTIHPEYNDSYTIETIENIEEFTLLPEFNISLYNENHSDFVEGVNANIKKVFKDPLVIFSVITKTNVKMLNIIIKPYVEMRITAEKGCNFLRVLHLNPNVDDITPGFTRGANISSPRYNPPNVEMFKNQEITISVKRPILKTKHEIVLNNLLQKDVFDQISEKIIYETRNNLAHFKTVGNKVFLQQKSNVEITMNRNSCPKLMDALNLKNEVHTIRGDHQFDYSEIVADDVKMEKFEIIEYEKFPIIRKESKTLQLNIPSGMYQNSKDFFKEFQHIYLRELFDSKVELVVRNNTKVTFNEKLSNILGFIANSFTEGSYKSDYILELRAGISEVYVYCDIVSSSLVGDVSAPILKIIPIANEYKEQIVKQFSVPLYFPIKKHHFDVIEIELVTSSGTPIKFLSGKTNIVLSFRRKIL